MSSETSAEETSESDATGSGEEAKQPLLGHLSMLLDLKLTPDRRHVLTCDRDEKIRVSNFPNAYNIHGYCLGHTEFVSSLALVPGCNNRVLSSSGDGTIKVKIDLNFCSKKGKET